MLIGFIIVAYRHRTIIGKGINIVSQYPLYGLSLIHISPDKDAIEENMQRAFLLCDKSAFNYYKDLAEKGYYNRAISGNINQRIEVDSIDVYKRQARS